MTTADGRAQIFAQCPAPDILVNNAGGPPPENFRDWRREEWITALDANMLAPIEMMRMTVDRMGARKFGRMVNITSSAVKAPIDILGRSNGARSGLTGFVAGLARATVINNVTINNLLPGPFDTGRLRATLEASACMSNRTLEQVEQEWLAKNPAGRFGRPREFGAMCAFLCSAHADYVTGQNILMDGGGLSWNVLGSVDVSATPQQNRSKGKHLLEMAGFFLKPTGNSVVILEIGKLSKTPVSVCLA